VHTVSALASSQAERQSDVRFPGFTNCKPKYRKPDGLFPFLRLHSHTGQQYPMAEAFEQAIKYGRLSFFLYLRTGFVDSIKLSQFLRCRNLL
jgi:hypothetical protein